MSDKSADPLAEALRHWRTSAGFTLRELAARVGADFTYISKIEHGHDHPSRRLVSEIDAATHADTALLAVFDMEPCTRCGALPVRAPLDRRVLLALADRIDSYCDHEGNDPDCLDSIHACADDVRNVAAGVHQ